MMMTPLQEISTFLEKGLSLHRQGRAGQAKKIYLKALEANPRNAQALHLLGIVEYEKGRLERSVQLIQSAIKVEPGQADFYLSLGNALKKKGHAIKALACFNKAIRLNPELSSAYFNLALVHLDSGQASKALESLKQALQTTPDCIDAHMLIGQTYLGLAQIENAVSCFQNLLRFDPGNNSACFYLGVAFLKAGKTYEALDCFQKVVAREPAFAEAYLNIGLIYAQHGDNDAATLSYTLALEKDPDMSEALNNMGNLCMGEGEIEKATAWYKQAVSKQPAFKEALLNLANSLRKSKNFHDALESYERLLIKFPSLEQAIIGKGCVYKDLGQHNKAIACFINVLELNPKSSAACDNLSIVYNDIGRNDKARAYLDRKISIQPDFADEVKRAMMLPVIYNSVAAIDACRKSFEEDLERLRKRKKSIADPYHQVGATNFILALHGQNEKSIRKKIARFYIDVCPDLQWTSPSLSKRKSGKKIKIGMVSSFFQYNTIGNLYHGLIQKLSKGKFSLILYRFPGQEDHLSKLMDAAADEVISLPLDVKKAREKIAEKQLDVLFFPELGMDALTYFIAFSRLAPVQCKRGFQITMGIPSIDYFISSDSAEPTDAQRYYSEKLVRLKGTGYYFYRPEMPKHIPDRASFGLPEDRTLYACPQSLFKLHPDFDPVLSAVLKKDPNGVIVLLEGLHPQWKAMLMKRFEKTIPGATDRIHFVPRQPREVFLNLYLLADAVIDTIHFSGGHTSLECFAWGIPVVTWPGSMLPGRLTYGFYKQMGVMDCVAKDQTAYVNIAHRLANDLAWRQEVGRKITENSAILFNNIDDVVELEKFFENAVNSAYNL